MGAALWSRLQRLADRARDFVVANLARRAGPRLVVGPSIRWSAKRLRQVPTVCVQTPSFDAISLFLRPPAAANTTRARSATACGAPCLRVNAVSSRFSTSSSTIATARPLAILPFCNNRVDTCLQGAPLHRGATFR